MSGPSAQVPLRAPLAADAVDAPDRWLRSIAVHREGGTEEWPLHVRDEAAMGPAAVVGPSRRACKTLEERDYDGEEERSAVAACLDFRPAQWVSLDIESVDADGQRILGQLALLIAECSSSFIDLGPVVSPAATIERWLRSAGICAPWLMAKELRAFVATLPGCACEIPADSSF